MTLVTKLVRTSLAALSVAAAVDAQAVTAAEMKGTWTGTWAVTQWYAGSEPIEGEAFDAAFRLVITDPVDGVFGKVYVDVPAAIAEDYTGDVIGFGPDLPGGAVAITVAYPDLIPGRPAATLTGILSGQTLSGVYAENDLPLENYVHWTGNITLTTPVPEPEGIAMAACGLAVVGWRQRRRTVRA